MKILNFIGASLFMLAIVFLFFNWKLAILLAVISTLIGAFPRGPSYFLNALSGDLIIVGIIYLFINWKIGIALIVGAYLVAKFRIYGNKCNYDYYEKKKQSKIGEKEEIEEDGFD